MNAEEMQKAAGITQKCETFEFGSDDPEKLIQLTLKGIKRATTGALRLYRLDKEPLPKPGRYNIILDDKGNARCMIMNTKIIICRFKDVSASMAKIEGEGDQSLEYWKKEHLRFFTKDYSDCGLVFTEEEDVVFQQYELIYPSK